MSKFNTLHFAQVFFMSQVIIIAVLWLKKEILHVKNIKKSSDHQNSYALYIIIYVLHIQIAPINKMAKIA